MYIYILYYIMLYYIILYYSLSIICIICYQECGCERWHIHRFIPAISTCWGTPNNMEIRMASMAIVSTERLGREAVYGNSSRWFKFSQELTSHWYKLLCGWWTSARTCLRWVEAHIERCSLVSHGSLDEDKPNNQEVVPRPGGHPIRFRCTHSKCTKWIMIFAAHAKHSETLCVCIRLYKYIYNAMWYTHT